MKRFLPTVVAAAGLIAASLSILAGTSAAGQNTFAFDYSPEQGPAGITITVSGTCLVNGNQPTERARVRIARRVDDPQETPFDKSQNYEVGGDGSWSGSFMVPSEAPADDYLLQISCVSQDQFFGEPLWGEFVVTQGPLSPPTTSTTTTSTTVAPTIVPPPTLPPAPPATPVAGNPTFTG